MPRPAILNSIERKFILFFGDILLVLVSLNVFVNHAIDMQYMSPRLKVSVFSFGILSFLMLSYILEFYNLNRRSRLRYAFSQAIYVSVIFVFVVFIFTVLAFDASFWRKPLLYFLLMTPMLLGLWRLLFANIFRIIPDTKNVLYIYDGSSGLDDTKNIDQINGLEGLQTFYRVKLTYDVEVNNISDKPFFRAAADKVDAWIINIKDYEKMPQDVEKDILRSVIRGKEVITFTSFYENTYEALPLRSHNNSFYEILQLRNKRIRYIHRIFSFGLNLLLSIFVGFAFLIAIPFVWFFNLFFNQGSLFYTQKRVGFQGAEFKIYKFRSMVPDAEKEGAKMATKNDSRITPFGKVLRLFRIDELPQILSVINGDMQFIGPRPERKIFVDKLNKMIPFYNARHLIKPGITGWAQVKYKYGENLEDSMYKLEYDLYYIKNKSVTLDLRILFKTISTVLFSRGV